MAGKIVADTLEHSTAGSVDTQYVVNGSAKAWVNYNGSTATGTADTTGVRDSLNIASLVDDGTGDQTLNFSSAMSNANYVVQSGEGRTENTNFYFGFTNIINVTTTAFNAQTGNAGGTNIDFFAVQLSVNGDLA